MVLLHLYIKAPKYVFLFMFWQSLKNKKQNPQNSYVRYKSL